MIGVLIMKYRDPGSLTFLTLALALALTASCGGDAPAGGAGSIGPVSTLERNQALHIPMRDGVRIAVDVWLPEGIEPGTSLPAMVRATRYWRARGFVNAPIEGASNFDEAERWNGAGYALVLVDARGSGASFGIRRFELAEDEVQDYGEVVDWIVAQPWSNGRVGSYGVSYAGNTAEMLAVSRHPAVKAVAPLFNDFDNFGQLVFPGGVLTVGFLESWSNRTRMQDLNDICGLSRVSGPECATRCACRSPCQARRCRPGRRPHRGSGRRTRGQHGALRGGARIRVPRRPVRPLRRDQTSGIGGARRATCPRSRSRAWRCSSGRAGRTPRP